MILRKQLKLTPKEEEKLIEEVVSLFVGLIETNLYNKIEKGLENFLQRETYDSDDLVIKYSIDVNVGVLRGFVGKMRKGKQRPFKIKLKKNKKPNMTSHIEIEL